MNNKQADVVKILAQPIYGKVKNKAANSWFSDLRVVTELEEK